MRKNKRTGCRSGATATRVLPVSFDVSDALVGKVQRAYSTGFYTQKELAIRFKISYALSSKICRVSPDNVDEAMRNIRRQLKTKKLRKVS